MEKGARDIIAERLSVMAPLRDWTRKQLNQHGVIRSQGELAEDSKFKDYADFAEPLSKIASHRAMALFRGRDAGELSLAIQLETPEGILLDDLGRLIDAPKHPRGVACAGLARKLLPQIEGYLATYGNGGSDALGMTAKPAGADGRASRKTRWVWTRASAPVEHGTQCRAICWPCHTLPARPKRITRLSRRSNLGRPISKADRGRQRHRRS